MQRYVAQQPPSSYSAVLAKCVRRLIPPDFLLRYPYARRGAPSVTHTLDFVVRHGYVLLFFWIRPAHGALPFPPAPLLPACGRPPCSARIQKKRSTYPCRTTK